jgi:hypothetical protein
MKRKQPKKIIKKTLKKRLILLAILASGFLLVKLLIWDNKNNRWIIQDLYYSAPLDAKLTIAPEITPVSANLSNLVQTEVNDASKLNPIAVAGVLQPTSVEAIKELVKAARSQMYATLSQLFQLKLKYDPQEIFYNAWYAEFH